MSGESEALGDRHVRILAVLMHLCAAPLLLMLVLTPIAAGRMILLNEAPPEDERVMVIVVFAFAILLGVYGAAMLIIARGLWKKRRWAGFGALLICVSWFPAGLLPFAVYGLFALLRPAVYRGWFEPVQPTATADRANVTA